MRQNLYKADLYIFRSKQVSVEEAQSTLWNQGVFRYKVAAVKLFLHPRPVPDSYSSLYQKTKVTPNL
jgi:hypothetical protein